MVKIADLKNNLSRHLASVRQGREITVLDRETPVARLVPFVPGDRRGSGVGVDPGSAGRIADLARQGVLVPGDVQAAATWLDAHPPVTMPDGTPSAVDLLLEMRRASAR